MKQAGDDQNNKQKWHKKFPPKNSTFKIWEQICITYISVKQAHKVAVKLQYCVLRMAMCMPKLLSYKSGIVRFQKPIIVMHTLTKNCLQVTKKVLFY